MFGCLWCVRFSVGFDGWLPVAYVGCGFIVV